MVLLTIYWQKSIFPKTNILPNFEQLTILALKFIDLDSVFHLVPQSGMYRTASSYIFYSFLCLLKKEDQIYSLIVDQMEAAASFW